MRLIAKMLKWLLPKLLFEFIRTKHNKLKSRRKDREREKIFISNETKLTGGENNPNITFYVIRRAPLGAGLFSNFNYVLGHLMIANKRNLTPVVDMENYETFYNEETPINGTRNAWEYYFEQPSDFTLQEVYGSKNVILSCTEYPDHILKRSSSIMNSQSIAEFHSVVCKQMKFNKSTVSYIEECMQKYMQSGVKTLGVSIRGTDYTRQRPARHSVQPSIDQLIEITTEKMAQWGIDYVYVATEEAESLDRFKEVFTNKVLATKSMRHSNYRSDLGLPSVRFNRDNDKYISGLEYLSDIVLLSRCDYLIGTIVHGLFGAIVLNGGKYIDKHIIDLGRYP